MEPRLSCSLDLLAGFWGCGTLGKGLGRAAEKWRGVKGGKKEG